MGMPQLIEKIAFTDEQIQVLNGAMLGDGSLYLHKNGKNAQFIYLSKSKQHVEFVSNYFKKYWSGEGLKKESYFDQRTQKEYTHYKVRTYTNQSFTDKYYEWYIDGVKHLPHNLILTPLTCLIWYIGDGGLLKNGGGRSENIKLSTHCFLKEEQEQILLPQLTQFEASLMAADKNKEQYYIYIPHRKEKEFLEYIGTCPFSDYEYKWNYTPYKNAQPKNHTDKEQIFCEMYLNGKSYYQIAKEFNVDPSVVRHYLIKNNIYISQNNSKIKNAVIAYTLDEKPYQIYVSGAAASKELGIIASGISNVISGRRLQSGGYKWKKYKNLTEEEQIKIQTIFPEYFEKGD